MADVLTRAGSVEDVKVISAALLHDTVEDTETTIDEPEARFGKRVAAIVTDVTDDQSLPSAVRKRIQVMKAFAEPTHISKLR